MAVLVGSTKPRIHTPPLRELTKDTSWGFDIIWFAKNILGQPLTPWQEWFVIHAFELLARERVKEMYPDSPEVWDLEVPRFKTIVLMIARQNGKTHIAKVIIKWALFRKRMRRIMGAAQTKNDAKDLWEEVLEESEENPKLRKRMRRPTLNNGHETMRSKTGTYRIAGLDRKAGRGKTVNFLFMDELREHKTWDGWSALSSTTLSPVGAINLCASNAGDFRSVVLKSLRDGARKAIDAQATEHNTVGWFEWSADENLPIDDRTGWAQANPDLGHGRMTERDIQAEMEAKDEDEFRTENLCQWVDDLLKDEFIPVISDAELDQVMTPSPPTLSHSVISVDADPEGEMCSISLAGRAGKKIYGMVGYHGPLSVKPVVDAVLEVCQAADPMAILIDPKSPAEVLITELEERGLEVQKMKWTDVKSSTRAFLQGVDDRDYLLAENQLIRDAFDVAELREDGEGGVAWKRRSGVICQLVALSAAMWGVARHTPLPKQPKRHTAMPREIEDVEPIGGFAF